MSEKKVTVTVAYTGQDEYVESFAPEVPIGTIKHKAMHEFKIEESAADKYVLQLNGTNLDDKTKIGDLGKHDVNLDLMLKEPQQKGYAG